MIYLASPYSHPLPAVRDLRFRMACDFAARLMAAGDVVYSPIAHSHPIAEYLPPERTLDHDFWMAMDLPVLERADKVLVLRLQGWERSRGVAAEIKHATAKRVPVEFADY